MKIGIACGGTGGHIFPGLATAEVLRARGHEVTLWVSGRDIEKEPLGGWNGPLITVPTRGFPLRPGIKQAGALWMFGRAFLQCRRQMRLCPPDIFLAMGGYASVAPVMAARLLSIPVILHEANVIPGRANRFLSRWADVFTLGFEETRNHITHRNMIYTGMPLRKMKAENTNIDWNMFKPGIFTILIMGGSRGAHKLNEVAAKTVVNLHAEGKAVQIIHLTGAEDEINVRKIYLACGVPHLVFSFLHNMDQAYGQTSLAICRAGASTCAELAQYGVPALLIPYPHAASDH
ncbi:MAG: UDP-N-acetylglucosamine--N-acetylmuramyl-(pentapeptide) pyrophosphoryl-undecaprenol N-acetylglucosamine transferase, partial [Kiritimatiellia bacterium]|nr:UDP-N-acetylglucosamine--N-acetylmuramyl-(pentapeptide) pyrophosphoryl-undecaprenol N-acetylglucosamine transferase [Kiritimatiellia bacterium]